MKNRKLLRIGTSFGLAIMLLGIGVVWALPPRDQIPAANPREGAYEACYHVDDAGVAFVPAPAHGEDYEIQWEEPVVEAAVRGYLGKPDGPVLHSDVWDIHVFDLDGNGARILREAKNGVFPTISKTWNEHQVVAYQGEKLKTLGDFRHFDALQILSLAGNTRYVEQITELAGVEELENLTVLRLINCVTAKDLTPLSECEGLETLTLSGYSIENLTAVQPLTDLKRLEIGGIRARDLTPLADLQKLEYLYLGYGLGDNTCIKDYTPLGELKALRMLDLTNTTVKDLAFCEGLPRLETLRMMGTPAAENWQHWKETLPNVLVRFNY